MNGQIDSKTTVNPANGLGHGGKTENASDGWMCFHCGHDEWVSVGANGVDCTRCLSRHSYASVVMAITRRNAERYQQLIYAVTQKFPGESRFDTALRYIMEREAQGTSASGQDGNRLEAQPAGPVLKGCAP